MRRVGHKKETVWEPLLQRVLGRMNPRLKTMSLGEKTIVRNLRELRKKRKRLLIEIIN